MASIWLEPITHETHSYHSDPIKLRRPLLISEIRIAKPQSMLLQMEFLAKDLRLPSDELVSLERIERVEPSGNDMAVKLFEPILTNFLVVKGEYKSLTLCLEANEATINNSRVTVKPVRFTQTDEEIELLMISPLDFHGVFKYWIDYEDNGTITSIRYLCGDFAAIHPASFTVWRSTESANSFLAEIEGLVQSMSTGYLGNLEKLGGLLESFLSHYHTGHDAAYSGLRILADSKLPMSLVKIAISALEGKLHGLMESKAALTLTTHLLALPRLARSFLESSGLSHLLFLVTHPSASSQLISRILGSFHALVSVPQNASYFLEKDVAKEFDTKAVQTHFTFPKKLKKDDGKKQKTEEEVVYKTGYQILFGFLIIFLIII